MEKPDVKKLKAERDVEGLCKALVHQDSGVRRKAAEAFGEIKDTKAVELLIQLLKDEDIGVRIAAAETLGKIGDARAAQPLLALLRYDKSLVDGKIGIGGYAAAISANAVPFTAVEALEKIGKPAVEPLIEVLKVAHKDIRYRAALVLGNIGDARAVRPLIEALKDKDWFTRDEAARSLEKIGEPVVELLTQAFGDEDKDIQKSAKKVLERIQKELKKKQDVGRKRG
jgi:HEAT repeat protein